MRKRAPLSLERTSTRPRCALTIARTIARPSPEPWGRCAPPPSRARKLLEDGFLLGARHADAVVGDRDDHVVGVGAGVDGDALLLGRRVLPGVGQQIAQRLRQRAAIARHGQARLRVTSSVTSAPKRTVSNAASASLTTSAMATARRSNAAWRDSIFDSSISLPTMPSRRASSWLITGQAALPFDRILYALLAQRVDEHADRCQRRAQLVRDRRQELVLHARQRGAAGHEDGAQRVAGQRGRAEGQHEDPAHERHRLGAAGGDQHDANRGDQHRRQQRREDEDQARAVEEPGRGRAGVHPLILTEVGLRGGRQDDSRRRAPQSPRSGRTAPSRRST